MNEYIGYTPPNRPEPVNPAQPIIDAAVEQAAFDREAFTTGDNNSTSAVDIFPRDEDGILIPPMIWGLDNWLEADWSES